MGLSLSESSIIIEEIFELILSGTKFKCFNEHLAQPEERQTVKGKQLIGAPGRLHALIHSRGR